MEKKTGVEGINKIIKLNRKWTSQTNAPEKERLQANVGKTHHVGPSMV